MDQFINWKTVAGAAGAVIVFVCGLLAGLWNSDDIERRHQAATTATEVRELEQRVIELREKVKWLTDVTVDQEQRIRANERILSKFK